jgi:hypothetical protein
VCTMLDMTRVALPAVAAASEDERDVPLGKDIVQAGLPLRLPRPSTRPKRDDDIAFETHDIAHR